MTAEPVAAPTVVSETDIIELTVNGERRQVHPGLYPTLLQALREELTLTGTKYGCGEGLCGACTVLLDGIAVRSCQYPTVSAAGKRIITIEGLVQNGRLHTLQQVFIDEDAMQCGYCTPGMIMNAAALLQRNPEPTDKDIITAMNGNICRCNNYTRIIAAIRKAAGR